MSLIKLRQTPLFKKTCKKRHKKDRLLLNKEIKKIIQNPSLGQLKKGDLAGVRVAKFKISVHLYLLGYTYAKKTITLLSFGSHENYYKALKKYLG